MVRVFIEKEVRIAFWHKKLFKKIANETIDLLKIKGDCEINVILVNNEMIKEISKEYKKKDKATDVLSFPAEWKKLSPLIGYNMLGDIYISYEKIASQAKEYNHSKKREWAYLFAHGVLHLCGYDHMTENEEKEMNGLADKIMKIVKVGRDV